MNIGERFLALSLIWGCVSSVVALALIESGIYSDLVFAIKDLPIYLAAALFCRAWLGSKGGLSGGLLIGLLLVLLVANFYLLNPNYAAPLKNMRQIVAPLIVLLIYCKLNVRITSVDKIISWLCFSVILVLSFGVVEQSTELWKKVGLGAYFNLKGIPTDSNGLSYMFYEPLFNYRERMTSTFLDPISLGHYFATAAIFLFYFPRKTSLVRGALFCCFVGLFLTLSKGALLQVFVGIFILNPRIHLVVRAAFVALPLLGADLLDNATGISIHINGFVNSLKTITLFGHGVGSVGNYTKMFSTDMLSYMALGVSDTFVGALLGQIGVFGFGVWIGIAFFIIFGSAKSKAGAVVSLRIFLSILVVAVLSENTMNITSFLIPAAIIGLAQTAFSAAYVDRSIEDASAGHSVRIRESVTN